MSDDDEDDGQMVKAYIHRSRAMHHVMCYAVDIHYLTYSPALSYKVYFMLCFSHFIDVETEAYSRH